MFIVSREIIYMKRSTSGAIYKSDAGATDCGLNRSAHVLCFYQCLRDTILRGGLHTSQNVVEDGEWFRIL